MDNQAKIERLKTALAAVDNAIAQTEAALQSSATNQDDVRALRANLVDLQAQLSQLGTDLINLEAAQGSVPALVDREATVQTAKPPRPRGTSVAQTKELKRIHTRLNTSIVDRSVIQATRDHSDDVLGLVKRLRELT